MMRFPVHPVAAFVVGGAVLAAVLAAPSVFASTSGHVTVLHFREPTTNGSAINAAGKANRQGDYLAWDDPIKNASTGKRVGHVAGVCMLVDVKTQTYDCGPVTYILSGGTIFADGLLLGSGKPVPGPIIGGTGKYQNARGTITVTAVSPALTDHVIRLNG